MKHAHILIYFFTLNVFYTSYFIFLPLMSLTGELVNTIWDPRMCAQPSVILSSL